MKEENAELKKTIKSLESELEASMRREDMLLHSHGRLGAIKERLKNTAIGRVAANPNSTAGKVVRLPRTIYRIVLHPSIVKDIRQKNSGDDGWKKIDGEVEDILVPIRYIMGSDNSRRLNLVVEKIDVEMLRMAIELANKENIELRVVTYGMGAGSVDYGKMVKNKKIPKAKNISFYSSVDQMKKNKIFELEIGKNDTFLTTAWRKDGRKKTD